MQDYSHHDEAVVKGFSEILLEIAETLLLSFFDEKFDSVIELPFDDVVASCVDEGAVKDLICVVLNELTDTIVVERGLLDEDENFDEDDGVGEEGIEDEEEKEDEEEEKDETNEEKAVVLLSDVEYFSEVAVLSEMALLERDSDEELAVEENSL
ncbi:hypothetical protein ACO0QE_002725 [Hanseniaspora vineae]